MTEHAEQQEREQRSSIPARQAIEALSSQQQHSYYTQSHLTLQRWSVRLAAPLAIVLFAMRAMRPSATWRESAIFIFVTCSAGLWALALRHTKKGEIEKAAGIFICSVIGFVSFCMFLFKGMAGTSIMAMAVMVAYSALVSTRLLYFAAAASVVGFVAPALVYALGAYPIPQQNAFERMTTSVAFGFLLIPVIAQILLSRRRMNQHLIDTLVEMNQQQNAAIENALEVSSDIEGALDKIEEIAGAFSSQAGDQATAIAQINSAVAELSVRAAQTTQAAKSASEIVREVQRRSSEGVKRLAAIEKGFALIIEVNEVAQAEFADLAAQAERIEDILGLNRELAGQIKILAVNAGIQAAKAGSYGSGFRVVANELKAMIIRTDQSLSEGRELLEQIRTRARHSADSIQSSSEILNRQFEELSSTAASIEGIAENFSETSTRIAIITEEVRHQRTALEEVRNGADYIDFSAKDLDDSAKALKGSVERIACSTAALKQALR